jgi:DNA-directed RNA polymerase specialized sigma24 family protein
MATEAGFSDVVKRLDAMVALLVFLLPDLPEERSLRERIKLLSAAGLAPSEIAKIVDRPQPAVNSELARIRGKKAKTRRAKE